MLKYSEKSAIYAKILYLMAKILVSERNFHKAGKFC